MEKLALLESFCRKNAITCLRDESLRTHCSFRIGGPAALFIRPASEMQIFEVIRAAAHYDVPTVVLGNGSNVLLPDEGLACAVIQIGAAFGAIRMLSDTVIACDSGASLKTLCEFARKNSLGGLEFAYGIPGSVGGAIYMNAGAYDGEIKDVLTGTRHVSAEGSGEFTAQQLDLSYRHSAYCENNLIITQGIFTLQKSKPMLIREKMNEYLRRRREKQPLEFPSAGSTFKRPQGAYASALIDTCGLKGKSVGGAQVSEKHAGFIINTGGATRRDVLDLIDLVQREVLEKTGHKLECEVKIIG